jgi:transposase InsO family protein
MVTGGLSERPALAVVRMSAAALRYAPRPDPDLGLGDRIVALAHRHRPVRRRHDLPEAAPARALRQSQAGGPTVCRGASAGAAATLQEGHAGRPPADRPPHAPNDVWSADFVFDRTAEGRVLKCLTIVDDATTEAVAVVPALALGGLPVTRVLDALALTRGLPQVLRTDNGPEFCGRTMLTRAYDRGVTLRLIEPGKPTHAPIESFNGRFRDECLNEHWFTSLAHAQVVIETWRREYNEERPKKGLGGLTPSAYARQLTARTETTKVTAGL